MADDAVLELRDHRNRRIEPHRFAAPIAAYLAELAEHASALHVSTKRAGWKEIAGVLELAATAMKRLA